jgi:hypothetical protein
MKINDSKLIHQVIICGKIKGNARRLKSLINQGITGRLKVFINILAPQIKSRKCQVLKRRTLSVKALP